jgi:hypothetical protein
MHPQRNDNSVFETPIEPKRPAYDAGRCKRPNGGAKTAPCPIYGIANERRRKSWEWTS